MTERPLAISFKQRVKVQVTQPRGNSIAVPQLITARYSKDIENELASTFEFTVDNALKFFNQFGPHNPYQHGSKVEVWLNNISSGTGGIPPGIKVAIGDEDWIKRFTGYVSNVTMGASGGSSKTLHVFAPDRLWSVLNATARIHTSSEVNIFRGHMVPLDSEYLVWQIVQDLEGGGGAAITDLDETTKPRLRRFVLNYDGPGGPYYDHPEDDHYGRESWKGMVPLDEYDVNYDLGRVVFKQPQIIETHTETFYRAFYVSGTFYAPLGDPYRLEEALTELLMSSHEFGGPDLIPVTDFNFYDLTGRALYTGPDPVADRDPLYDWVDVRISRIDWDEDSGTGQDFLAFLRERGVMPYNYFLHCDADGLIRGEYVIQAAAYNNTISREILAELPNSMDEVFTRALVLSDGNTYPEKLIDMDPGSVTYNAHPDADIAWVANYFGEKSPSTPMTGEGQLCLCYDRHSGWTNSAPPYNHPQSCSWFEHTAQIFFAVCCGNYKIQCIALWEHFGEMTNLTDGSVFTYCGFGAMGRFDTLSGIGGTGDYYPDEPLDPSLDLTGFYFPFPNKCKMPCLEHGGDPDPYNYPYALNQPGSGERDLIFVDIIMDDAVEVDKILLQMYIPKVEEEDRERQIPHLRSDGDSRIATEEFNWLDIIYRFQEGSPVFCGLWFDHILEVHQNPLLSILYGTQEDFDEAKEPSRNLSTNTTVFSMDPMKCDTKILDLDGTRKVKTFRILFHQPFAAFIGHSGETPRDVALYFLNTFQAYGRSTITLPGVNAEGDKQVPFARITDSLADVSILTPQEFGIVANPVAADSFVTLHPYAPFNLDYTGCFICVPDPTGNPGVPYIAEVLYNEKNTPIIGQQTIHTLVEAGQPHTDLLVAGVAATDEWYLMHPRWWLDLLGDRIDMYKPSIYGKLDDLHLPWKTMVIENDHITTLGAALRKCVHEVVDSIANFSGISISVAYRPDYAAVQTVQDPSISQTSYLLTAVEYVFDNQRITVNLKLVDFNQLTT